MPTKSNNKNIVLHQNPTQKDTYYKFRNFDNMEYLLDIFLNQRLYAARFDRLNDPLEGYYNASSYENILVNNIRNSKLSLRICSATNKYSITGEGNNNFDNIYNLYNWIFYSNSGKGFAIEFEVIDDKDVETKEIKYLEKNNYLNTIKNKIGEIKSKIKQAKIILTHKVELFKNECEIRLFKKVNSNEKHAFVKIKIKKIYLGYDINETKKSIINAIIDNYNICQSSETKIEIEKIKRDILIDKFLELNLWISSK